MTRRIHTVALVILLSCHYAAGQIITIIPADGTSGISPGFDNNRIAKTDCPEIIITSQSAVDTTICMTSGATGHFFIEAVNATGYQWQLNTGAGWNDIVDNATYSGATGSALNITGIVVAMNNYQYRCRAYNNTSELHSASITMHVSMPVTPAVSITASANNICPGTPVTFTATASNAGSSPSYEWYKNGVLFGTGNSITTSVLANGDDIVCFMTASNSCVTFNSLFSNVIVMSVIQSPVITIAASANNICSATSVTFTATVFYPGTAPVFQWKKNGVNVGINGNNYTTNTLANGDTISCTYSSNVAACGSTTVTSNSITMAVTPASLPTIYIYLPGGCEMLLFDVLLGNPITFNATITNGGSAPVYQWKRNGANVGTNSPVYIGVMNLGDVITCVLTSNATCVVINTVTSNGITTDLNGGGDLAVTLSASNDMCEAGVPVTFIANVSNGGASPTFQWKKNGINVGGNSNSYTENSPAVDDVFSCTVFTTPGCSSNSTATASITFECTACSMPGGIITSIVYPTNRPLGAVKGFGGNIYYTHAAKVSMLTPTGNIVLLAGQNAFGYAGDGGPATSALLAFPAVVVTSSDGTIYFNEFTNQTIRKIDPNGIISTIANTLGTGGEGSSLNLVQFQSIEDIYLDSNGDLYIVDVLGNKVKKCNMATNQTYTIAGTGVAGFSGDGGPATAAQFNKPTSVAVDSAGNIYITDEGNFRIRKINPAGIITTFAGTGVSGKTGDGGPALAATLFKPHDLDVDNTGNVYLGDWGNGVRKISAGGIITRVAGNGTWGYSGNGGPATLAQSVACNVSVDAEHNIYISDFDFDAIRKVHCGVIAINRQPVDTIVCGASSNVSFTINTCNSSAYQWQVNTGSGWNDINDNAIYSGTTNKKLNITGATTAMNNYQYRCRAYSECNTEISSPALLQIKTPQTPAVTITSSTGTICQGANVVFTATPQYGGLTPAYQWKINGISAGTNSNTFTSNTLVNGDQVTCVLTPSADECVTSPTATSNGITMIVNPLLTPGISITSPGNSICAGTPVTFSSATSNGGLTPVYQWKKNGVNVGTNSDSYTDNTLANGDVISCELNSNATCATPPIVVSNNVTMIVNPLLTPSIAITGSATTICAGTAVTFSSAISNGGASPVYQWKKNGVNVGANGNSYTDNTLSNGDVITCVLSSNAVCATPVSVTSNDVTMAVNPVVTPTVSVSVSSSAICAGETVIFSSVITHGGSLPIYQWQKNGINVGANSNSYSDNALNNGDIISCVLTSSQVCTSSNTAISNNITMTVNPVLTPTVVVTASNSTICAGTNVNFTTAIANSGATPSYQWKLNGVATGSDLPAYANASLSNNDIITCELTSSYICAAPAQVISNPVQMTVDPVLTPAVTISTIDTSICEGQPAIFNAFVTQAGIPVYEWKKNGLVVGTNSPSYSDNALSNNDAIACIVTANANCLTTPIANSNVIAMTIYNNPVVSLDQTPTLCTGATRQLDAGAFSAYLWTTGHQTRTINVTNAGTYSVVVTDNNGCTGNGSATITTMFPQPLNFLPSDTNFCNFGSMTLQPYSGYNSYSWSTGAISSSITTNQPGTYWLEVTDSNNCMGRSTVQVIMKECLKGLYVPTAFTPNNDGRNDVFKALLFGDIKKYELIIYNRWDNIVFRTKDPGKGWDGTFKGVEPSTAVFVWVCSYQLSGEPVKTEKGTVSLIR